MRKNRFPLIAFVLLLVCGVTLAPGLCFAAEPGAPANVADKANLDKMGNILILFLVLSLLFETAMTPIFNWTPFTQFCEGKGVKTPFVIIVAYLIFSKYNLDIVSNTVQAFTGAQSSFWGGKVLSAMLIAGGSDGIFRIFTKLGIRNPQERKDKAEAAREKAALAALQKAGTAGTAGGTAVAGAGKPKEDDTAAGGAVPPSMDMVQP